MNAARTIAAMLIVAGALSTSVAGAEDVKISLKDLPAPVRQAVDQNLLGGTIKGVSKEIEKGQTFYEIETIRSGHARDLLFDAEGHSRCPEARTPGSAVRGPVKPASP